ncbi:MAG: GNAT family N-acetyltransferase [Fimbriimonas sp.]
MGLVSADWVIREAVEVDPSLVLPLFNLTRSDPVDLAGFLERRNRFRNSMLHEVVMEVEGTVVGWGLVYRWYDERLTFQPTLAVAPEHRRKGYGSFLLEKLESQALALGATELRVEVRDSDVGAHDALGRRGYGFHNWMFESVLTLANLDTSAYESVVIGLRASGLEFATMAELGTREGSSQLAWAKAAWEIEYLTDLDIPGMDADERMTWDQYQEIVMPSPHYRPNAMVFALKDGVVAGMASLIEIEEGKFYNSATCVRREFRGQGLATALKVVALAKARDLGGKTVRTNNDARNAPMLAVNDRLGYVREPGWKTFAKLVKV